MNTFKKLLIVLMLAAASLFAACGVTETGNPGPVVEDHEDPTAAPPAYQNLEYGVTIQYPSGWSYDEIDESDVVFSDSRDLPTTATFIFTRLDAVPSSLISYLEDEYPEKTFLEYEATYLTGYEYDYPTAGLSGGDRLEYFFLNEDVLIRVEAEVLDDGSAEFGYLLNGVSF